MLTSRAVITVIISTSGLPFAARDRGFVVVVSYLAFEIPLTLIVVTCAIALAFTQRIIIIENPQMLTSRAVITVIISTSGLPFAARDRGFVVVVSYLAFEIPLTLFVVTCAIALAFTQRIIIIENP